MTTIKAMRQLLGELGIGSPGVTLFLADENLPTTMTQVLYSLTQTGGRFGVVTQDNEAIPEPSFQLAVRHGRHTEAIDAAEAAWKKFFVKNAPIVNRTVDDKFFLWVRPFTPPITLGPDAAQRARVVFNIGTSVRDVDVVSPT